MSHDTHAESHRFRITPELPLPSIRQTAKAIIVVTVFTFLYRLTPTMLVDITEGVLGPLATGIPGGISALEQVFDVAETSTATPLWRLCIGAVFTYYVGFGTILTGARRYKQQIIEYGIVAGLISAILLGLSATFDAIEALGTGEALISDSIPVLVLHTANELASIVMLVAIAAFAILLVTNRYHSPREYVPAFMVFTAITFVIGGASGFFGTAENILRGYIYPDPLHMILIDRVVGQAVSAASKGFTIGALLLLFVLLAELVRRRVRTTATPETAEPAAADGGMEPPADGGD
jgi:hypothetical protein